MASYYSAICSKYHPWFVEMGYPMLDVLKYKDGEWAIIQYENAPLIPSTTKWRVILQGLRNIEISRAFCEKYVNQIDTMKKALWDREDEKTRKMEEEKARLQRHKKDMVLRASQAILQNPDLCGRIAKNGIQEMGLMNIFKHIPGNRF